MRRSSLRWLCLVLTSDAQHRVEGRGKRPAMLRGFLLRKKRLSMREAGQTRRSGKIEIRRCAAKGAPVTWAGASQKGLDIWSSLFAPTSVSGAAPRFE